MTDIKKEDSKVPLGLNCVMETYGTRINEIIRRINEIGGPSQIAIYYFTENLEILTKYLKVKTEDSDKGRILYIEYTEMSRDGRYVDSLSLLIGKEGNIDKMELVNNTRTGPLFKVYQDDQSQHGRWPNWSAEYDTDTGISIDALTAVGDVLSYVEDVLTGPSQP